MCQTREAFGGAPFQVLECVQFDRSRLGPGSARPGNDTRRDALTEARNPGPRCWRGSWAQTLRLHPAVFVLLRASIWRHKAEAKLESESGRKVGGTGRRTSQFSCCFLGRDMISGCVSK